MFPYSDLNGWAAYDEWTPMKKKQRHVTAKTKVEVFRLFSIRNYANTLERSTDPLVVDLGHRIAKEADTMLRPYIEQEQKLVDPEQTLADARRRVKMLELLYAKKVKVKVKHG